VTIQPTGSAIITQASTPTENTGRHIGKLKARTVTETTVEKVATPDKLTTATDSLGMPDCGKKTGRAHGVLRLLAAGHFKPKPEQRLRVNFADLLPSAGPGTTPGTEADPGEPNGAKNVDLTSPPQPLPPGEPQALSGEVGLSLNLVNLIA
jgi:hypothetical protein